MDILDSNNKLPMVGHTGTWLGTCIEIGGLTASALLADRLRNSTGNVAWSWTALISGAILTGIAATSWKEYNLKIAAKHPKGTSYPTR